MLCWLGIHKLGAWGNPEPSKVYFDETHRIRELLVQSRVCDKCNIVKWRNV